MALSLLNRPEEGLTAFEKAIQLNPNDAHLWGLKAFALNALGRSKEAQKALEKAQQLGS